MATKKAVKKVAKKVVAKKVVAAKKVVKKIDKVERRAKVYGQYTEQLKNLGHKTIDEVLLNAIVDDLGSSNYKADAAIIACGDKKERERVVKKYVQQELAVADKVAGMGMVDAVCVEMKPERRKYRAVMYYILAKKNGAKPSQM
jgi:hypothetical protein